LAEVRAAIGPRPAAGHRPELLVDHLHRLDDAWGGLHEAHLAALATEMNLPLAQVRSAATGAGQFQLLPEGAQAPALTVRVCAGLACKQHSASELLRQLPPVLGADLRVLAVPCLGRCEQAPAALVGQVPVAPASAEGVLNTLLAECARPPGQLGAARGVAGHADLLDYRAQGGYALAARLYDGQQDPGVVLQALAQAGVAAARVAPGGGPPALLAVRIGAGDPARFQERHCLERDPHRLLEGLLLAAHASGAPAAAIHLRDDWHDCRRLLGEELAWLQACPPCPLPRIELRSGAGAPQAGSLALDFDHLFWLRELVEKGPGWLHGFGRRGRHGLRAISVSGAVNRPGVKLVPAGITLRELVEDDCDGLPRGQVLHGFVRGTAPGGMLPAGMADLPLEGDDPHAAARLVASLTVVVLAQPVEGGMQAGGTMGRSPLYRTAP
jgi:formate dehydrogenase